MCFGEFLGIGSIAHELAHCTAGKSISVTSNIGNFLAPEHKLGKIAKSGSAENVARIEAKPEEMLLDPCPWRPRWSHY
jgi:hypothetical protein